LIKFNPCFTFHPVFAGTTAVKRYESDREFIIKFLKALGFTNIFPIGDEIVIAKTLKTGEYLSQASGGG